MFIGKAEFRRAMIILREVAWGTDVIKILKISESDMGEVTLEWAAQKAVKRGCDYILYGDQLLKATAEYSYIEHSLGEDEEKLEPLQDGEIDF